jgi:hypothetical protein
VNIDKRIERLERSLRLAEDDPAGPTPAPEMAEALDELAAAKAEHRQPAPWAVEATEYLREYLDGSGDES